MKYSYSERSEKRGFSWENGTPVSAAPEQTFEADVVVIGAGIAGLTTAVRCLQKGFSVIIAEKQTGNIPRGNLIGVVPEGVDKKIFAKRWLRASGSRVSEELMWSYIDKSSAALSWLVFASEGEAEALPCTNRYENPDIGAFPGDYYLRPTGGNYSSEGGALAVEILKDAFARLGGKIFTEMTAQLLEKDAGGRVVSFLAADAEGKQVRFVGKKAVVLAAGDCGGDEEMLSALSPLSLRAGTSLSTGTGDGQKMAYWAGAELQGLYWPPYLGCSAFAPYTFFFTAINRNGRRFTNEDTSDPAKARHCMNQPEGEWAYTICDDKWYEELQKARGIAGGPCMMPEEGLTKEDIEAECKENMYRADTLEELAQKIEVPVDALLKTVERVNSLAAKGEDTDYGKRPELLTTIEKAPFYAFKWGPALLATFGGPMVDVEMKVLDTDDWPIPGLYAVGSCVGGIYAVTYPSVLAGSDLGTAITLALCAAEAIE